MSVTDTYFENTDPHTFHAAKVYYFGFWAEIPRLKKNGGSRAR